MVMPCITYPSRTQIKGVEKKQQFYGKGEKNEAKYGNYNGVPEVLFHVCCALVSSLGCV